MSTFRGLTVEQPSESVVREPASAPFLFWMLVLLGMSGLAPAVLLPEWRAYQHIRVTEQREQFARERLADAVAAERRLLDGLRTDPALLSRIAQRDLRTAPADAEVVQVPVEGLASAGATPGFRPAPVDPPAWVRRWTDRLPVLNYDAVFCESPSRPVIIAMSLTLICAALVLYGRVRSVPTPAAKK
ncbi:MAG: hypothetical protein KJ057_08315 [Phycisphaerae bacterium]|nr:MAG: hypothetical protein F9K17_07395 [Phycisphaerae bacterium]MBE7456343.1 hypothetical protein [Planctomycetia bacterium]MCK6465673.1 hypothetical protein [Phycisphaerae bacterium]MCL4718461.1 hypothetical protein [Phycisphaerae bacterium]NUQ09291.1 hypothetical protein [Phycisphaerae bacterium]